MLAQSGQPQLLKGTAGTDWHSEGEEVFVNLIVSADQNWGIGSNNQLLVRIPDDMRRFRELTLGKVIVMGRKTRESLPNGILDGRVNMILTHDKHYKVKGAVTLHSLEELNRQLQQYPADDVFLIGGEQMYRQLLDQCSRAYVTKIDFAYSADAYFPNLDQLAQWRLAEESEEQTYFDIIYHFQVYTRA